MIELNQFVISRAYHISNYTGYLIRYGNTEMGYLIPHTLFTPNVWKHLVKLSKASYMGDISLRIDGHLIRSVANAELKLLSKSKYKCVYVKYKPLIGEYDNSTKR